MKKLTIKKLKKEAEKLWSQVVLENGGGECFVCGKKTKIVPHHFVPRRISLALRFDPENGVIACQNCHISLHQKSDPIPVLIIAFKKGKEWVDYLLKNKKKQVVPNRKWYEEQVKKLKELN